MTKLGARKMPRPSSAMRRSVSALLVMKSPVTLTDIGAVFRLEAPFVPIRVEGVAQAVVVGEVGWMLGCRIGVEIGRRAAQDVPPGRQAPDDQARVGRRRRADDDVVAVLRSGRPSCRPSMRSIDTAG